MMNCNQMYTAFNSIQSLLNNWDGKWGIYPNLATSDFDNEYLTIIDKSYLKNFFRQFRIFVFDFDGVIVDSVKLKENIYCDSFGVDINEVKEQILIYVRNNTHMNREALTMRLLKHHMNQCNLKNN